MVFRFLFPKILNDKWSILMVLGGGGGKLPNANCDQTTKWKYPNLPTTNDQFGGGGKLPNANCDQITKWKYPTYQLQISYVKLKK